MDFGQIRDYSEFCDQLNDMRMRFQKWDSCEQTVAIYYLMVGLPFANAKFLHHALQHYINALSTPESEHLERNANDPAFIKNLLSERPHIALSSLQAHLPLLRPGNKDTAETYLMAIRKVLSDFITPPTKIYNECVEIMSYVFVHPAFGKEDKKSFKHLLKQVINRVTPENFVHSPVNESSDDSASPKPDTNNRFPPHEFQNRLNRRSNSLTPAQTTSSYENLAPALDAWSSQENLSQQSTKPRSYSLSSDKTIHLHNTMQSSSSETRLQDLQTICNQPMMKSIVGWLKSLRLHKYNWVFNNLSYDQMLELTDESLEAIGITKGARHKLLLSIAKLKERSSLLTTLETEVMNGCELPGALRKLKCIILSPMLVMGADEDLPAQFIKVMGKVCTQILMLRQPTEETLNNFAGLCDRAETSDAFTADQKRRLVMWRNQLKRTNNPPPPAASVPIPISAYQSTVNRFQTQPTFTASPMTPKTTFNHKSSSYPNVQGNQKIVGGHRHSIGSITPNVTPLFPAAGLLGSNESQATSYPQPIHKTHPKTNGNHHSSSLPTSAQYHVRFQDTDNDSTKGKKHTMKNVDIESNLESLCLQMMEHALGP